MDFRVLGEPRDSIRGTRDSGGIPQFRQRNDLSPPQAPLEQKNTHQTEFPKYFVTSRDEKVSRINVPAGLISGEPQDGNRGTGFPTLGEPRDVPPCPAVKPRDEDTMSVTDQSAVEKKG